MRTSLLIAGFLLIGLFGVAIAQNEVLPAKEPLPELPNPGLKPGDFFYFLDGWLEAIEEFFTFNPEAKALLQTKRALERIAEIKALLEEKGVDVPGLDVAQNKIQANIAKAARIIEEQKAKGRYVADLSQKLDDEFDLREELLKQTFKTEKAKLKAKKEEIKLQIWQAREAGDFEKISQLEAVLADIEVQKEKLKQRWQSQKEILELEEEKLEAELEAKEKELEALEEQEKELFEQKEKEIERAFEKREKALELQEKSLEIDLKKAVFERDTARVEEIRAQLSDLKAQKEALEQEEKAVEEALGKEKEGLEKARDLKERAQEQIAEAEEELSKLKEKLAELEIISEAVVTLMREAESKLAQANVAFEDKNYGQAYGQAMAAEMLAKDAERKIEQEEKLEERLEKLEKTIEKTERAGEEVEKEKLKEIEEFRGEIEKRTKERVREELEEEPEIEKPKTPKH